MSKAPTQRRKSAKRKPSQAIIKTQLRCRIKVDQGSHAQIVSTSDLNPHVSQIIQWINGGELGIELPDRPGTFSISGTIESEVANDPNPSLVIFEDLTSQCLDLAVKRPGRTVELREVIPEVGKYRLRATFRFAKQSIDKSDATSHGHSPAGEKSAVSATNFDDAIRTDVERLEAAVSALRKNKKGDESFGAACDNYTESAKALAATVLAERIRRSFEGKLGEDGKSNETLEEKIEHARTVRQWLGQWNLALENDSGVPVQLVGEKTPAKNGTFRLYPLAQQGKPRPISKWSIVRETLCSPTLVDITNVLHRRDRLRSR